jgi:hypothetical protein
MSNTSCKAFNALYSPIILRNRISEVYGFGRKGNPLFFNVFQVILVIGVTAYQDNRQ